MKRSVGEQLVIPKTAVVLRSGKQVVFTPVSYTHLAELTVIYEAEKAEHFSKTVTIYCNADNSCLLYTSRCV